MMSSNRTLAQLSVLLVYFLLSMPLGWAGQAKNIQPLILEGETIGGVGEVTRIDNLSVAANGSWLVEVDTNSSVLDEDGVVMKDGAIYFREGQALAQPAGALLDSFDALTSNVSGHTALNFRLQGNVTSETNGGVYFDDRLVLQEGMTAHALGFGANTIYLDFLDLKLNSANQILMAVTVDDPGIFSTSDRALVLLQVDAAGNVISHRALAKEGDLFPGQTENVSDIHYYSHNFALNNLGDVIFVADLNGDPAKDGVIYLNQTLLAQEGSDAPLTGRKWERISSRPVALNDDLDYVFSGNMDGDTSTDEIIIRNGAKFIQEGDSLPAIQPYRFTSFGMGPIGLTGNGDVIWYGDWDDSNSSRDTGIFVNQTLFVQEGVTRIKGSLVESLSPVAFTDGLVVSPGGNYFAFEATLEGGVDGAFLVNLDFLQIESPQPGVAGVLNTMSVNGATPGEVILLYGSFASGQGTYDCNGTPLLIEMISPFQIGQVIADANGQGQLQLFAKPGWLGRTTYSQAVEPGTCRLSNMIAHDF